MTHDLTFLAKQLDGCTLTAPEAVRLAADWWDKTGRHLTSKTFNRDQRTTFTPSNGTAPAIRVKDKGDVVLPSRILQGMPWAELDRRERKSIVSCWIEQYRQQYARANDAPKVVVQ